MMDLLKVACREGTDACKEMAADVLKQLEDYVAKNKDKGSPAKRTSGEIMSKVTFGPRDIS